jgi:hypothetical protein
VTQWKTSQFVRAALVTTAVLLGSSCLAPLAFGANVHVRGYYRANGTYVAPHFQSAPDGNFYNNWSTRPNVNPYTDVEGTRETPTYRTYTPTYTAPVYNFYTPTYTAPSYQFYTPTYTPRRYRY